MKPVNKSVHLKRNGTALIVSMIFLVVFAALVVGFASLSGANVQLASNQRRVNLALSAAQSGQEAMRYWLSRILMPSSTQPSDYLSTIVADLQTDLQACGVSNIAVDNNGSISNVTLDSETAQSFQGQLSIDPNANTVLQVYVTGNCGSITRTIKVCYDIQPYEHPIFNFGLATKGPLRFPGNPTLSAVNDNWEADIYVESTYDPTALYVVGNTNFDGDVNIGNPKGKAQFDGDVIIADDHGQEAIDNHVFAGVDPTDFPVPDADRFRQYATGDVIDSSTDLSKGMTLVNAKIPAGTNPNFESSVVIQGVLLIEAPNEVTFGRNVNLQGIIVADGDVNCPGTNKIDFLGNFDTDPFPQDPQFDVMRHETGASVIAPGFGATFAGNFSALDGVMAVSGVLFSGNANALVKGTILSYSDQNVVVEGNASLTFDRLHTTKVPGGFDTHRELDYNPSYYSVIP